MHARFYSPHLGRFLRVDPKNRYQSMKQPQRWNRYAYSGNNPLRFIDPDGEDLKLVFDFDESNLSEPQKTSVVVGVRERFVNAGVEPVQIFDAAGSVEPEIRKPNDRIVVLQYTTENLDEKDTVFGRNTPPSNKATISSFHGPEGERAMLNFLVNIGAHEAGHATRALPQYDYDSFPVGSALHPQGAAAGTIMEQGVPADVLGAEVREFSSSDAERLREALTGHVRP